MHWILQAALTALLAAAFLMLARRAGHRVAGIVNGLPLLTAPTLLWLALEQGRPFALTASTGALLACSVNAMIALAYTVGARRHGPLTCAAAALGLGASIAWPLSAGVDSIDGAFAMAAGVCGCVLALMSCSRRDPARPNAPPQMLPAAWIAIAAGVTSALISAAALGLGPRWAGLLASAPLLSTLCAARHHLSQGARGATRFYRGYVCGLLGQAGFVAVFAGLLGPLPIGFAFIAAAAAAVMLSWTLGREWRVRPAAAGGAATPRLRQA